MRKLILTSLISILFLCSAQGKVNVIPDNDLKIGLSERIKGLNPVTENDFNFVTKTLYKIYAPKISEKSGLKFILNANWKDDTVNAFATREVDSWSVHIAGGIARGKGMTKDSLALVICHEIGHHLAGAPRTFLYEGWPSAEGQADYWATSKCLKNYYQEIFGEEFIIDQTVPEKVVLDCNSIYKTPSTLKICLRSMMASLSFSQFLNSLPGVKTPISLETPDTRQVKGTNTNDYPRPQCRFDTLYQGALCDIDANVLTSDDDEDVGHCTNQNKPGTRPRCWYKP